MKATPAQLEFIDLLLDQTGEDYRKYTDKPMKALTKFEASRIIQQLVDLKDKMEDEE